MNVTITCNLVMKVASHDPCHIPLVISKSQVLCTLKGKGIMQGQGYQEVVTVETTLESVHHRLPVQC